MAAELPARQVSIGGWHPHHAVFAGALPDWPLAAAAAVLLVALIWTGRNWYFAGPPGGRARIDSIEGQAYRVGPTNESALKLGDELSQGEFIRTAANSRAKVRLFDGSEVEMNQRAELAVTASLRDATIHLDQGSIIVQAAKRHTGHLYVSAPDCTVAVTGTVFSVNSGTKGSRVAVIEGEVHVKHAGLLSILHSGDELATTQSVGLCSCFSRNCLEQRSGSRTGFACGILKPSQQTERNSDSRPAV